MYNEMVDSVVSAHSDSRFWKSSSYHYSRAMRYLTPCIHPIQIFYNPLQALDCFLNFRLRNCFCIRTNYLLPNRRILLKSSLIPVKPLYVFSLPSETRHCEPIGRFIGNLKLPLSISHAFSLSIHSAFTGPYS